MARYHHVLFAALCGCLPERVRYVDLNVPTAAALDRIDDEARRHGLERRGPTNEPILGVELTQVDPRPPSDGRPRPAVTYWHTRARVGIHARGDRTRLAIDADQHRLHLFFENDPAIELEPFFELGFLATWSIEPQVAVGRLQLEGEAQLRLDAGIRLGRVLARSRSPGEGPSAASTWRLGAGIGVAMLRDVMFRPTLSLAWERQRFVEHVPGERLPTGTRLYIELEAAALVGGSSGAEIALAAGTSWFGAIVLSASWLGSDGTATSVGYRMGTELSACTGAIAFLLLALVSKGADAITGSWDGPD